MNKTNNESFILSSWILMQQIPAKELDIHQPAAALHKSNTLYFCGVMVMHLESFKIR